MAKIIVRAKSPAFFCNNQGPHRDKWLGHQVYSLSIWELDYCFIKLCCIVLSFFNYTAQRKKMSPFAVLPSSMLLSSLGTWMLQKADFSTRFLVSNTFGDIKIISFGIISFAGHLFSKGQVNLHLTCYLKSPRKLFSSYSNIGLLQIIKYFMFFYTHSRYSMQELT